MTDRIALIVGIDEYQDQRTKLTAAVNDAIAVKRLLERHADDELNFACALVTSEQTSVTRRVLRARLEQLFAAGADGDVLFYFSGHGHLAAEGGVLVTQDGSPGDWGLGMAELMQLATASKARNILLLLDCCHSGALGDDADDPVGARVTLRDNLTILASSRRAEESAEAGAHGHFTNALLDALGGGAADMLGDVTPSAIFRCMERRSGGFGQRPVYKASTTRSFVVRRCPPIIPKANLRKLAGVFPTPDHQFQLDPEYEPENDRGQTDVPIVEWKLAIAGLIKSYRDASLLRPCDPSEQLYWAARRSHRVELTAAGKEWWHLVKANRV
jgi:Caspase domain